MTLRLIRSRRAALLGAGIAAAAAAFGGCTFQGSTADSADVESGKQLFVQSCGACHVLEDAGTTGRIGPNLDDSFRQARQAGFKESQFEGVTKRWIEIAQAPMPRDLVVGEDKDDVAAYVAQVAGTSEASTVRAAQPDSPQDPAIGTEDGLRRSRFGPLVTDVEGLTPATSEDDSSEDGDGEGEGEE